MDTNTVHGVALALAVDADGPLCGVLITGAPGAGKSVLALEAITRCRFGRTRLVADDIVRLTARRGRIEASAPERLCGLLEVRGAGPMRAPATPRAALVFAVNLDGPFQRIADPRDYQPAPKGARLSIYSFKADGPAPAARLIALARLILVDKFGDVGRNKQS